MDEKLKIVISAETKNFKSECDKAIKLINDFKQSNTEAETALETLKNTIDNQEKELKDLNDAYANIILTQGKDSAEAKKLEGSIKQLSSTLGDNKNKLGEVESQVLEFSNSLNKSETSLETLKNTIDSQEKELKDLNDAYTNVILTQGKNSDEAKKLEGSIKELNSALGDNKSKLGEAEKEVEEFSTSLSKSSVSFSAVSEEMKKYGDVSNKVLKAAATAAVGAATALLGVSAATSEYRESQGKLAAAFEAAGSSAETAKSTYNDLYRVLGESDVAVEAAAHLGKLTQDEQSLAEWTNICQGVYATFGDSLPIEGLAEAANETAKTGEVTGGLADALNWAGKEGETYGVKLKDNIEFTKLSNSELAKLTESQKAEYEARKAQYDTIEAYNKAVMEAASAEDYFNIALQNCSTEAEREALIRETLNGLYSEASATYAENNAQILAQNEANRQMNDAMAALGEVMAPVNTMLTQLGAEILAGLTPYIQQFAADYLPQIKEVLSGVGEKIGECITWIADNWELIATIGGIVLAIAGAISAVSTALTIYNTVMGVAAVVSAPVAGIVLAIVAAIAALTAAVVLCVKHWDEIKAKVTEVWENIKAATLSAVESVKQKFAEMKEAIYNKVAEIKQSVVDKFNAIKQSLSDIVSNTKQAVVDKYNAIKQSVSDTVSNTKQAVLNAYQNIKDGITEKVNAVKTTVTNVFNKVKEAIMKPINWAKDGVKTAIDKIKGFFDFEWSLPKIKLPHFSISGSFSLNPPSIPKFGVDWYAHGGVFDKPTLFPYGNGSIGGLGEAGAEAVVPLEKNTQWLDRIAERLQTNSNAPIYLQVDGKTFAEISVNSINALTKQRGSLPLKLV